MMAVLRRPKIRAVCLDGRWCCWCSAATCSDLPLWGGSKAEARRLVRLHRAQHRYWRWRERDWGRQR
jgi:hypothetical protein